MSKKKKSKLGQPSTQKASSGDKKIKAVYGLPAVVISIVALMIALTMTECVTKSPIRATQTAEARFTALAKLATPTHTVTNTPTPTKAPTPTIASTPTVTRTVRPTRTAPPTWTPGPTPSAHWKIEPELVFVRWQFMRLYNEFKGVNEYVEIEFEPYGSLSRTFPLRTYEEMMSNPFICLVEEQGDPVTDRTPCIKRLVLCDDETYFQCDTVLVVLDEARERNEYGGVAPPITYLGGYQIYFNFYDPMPWCADAYYSATIPSSKRYFGSIMLTGHGINDEVSCKSFTDLLAALLAGKAEK